MYGNDNSNYTNGVFVIQDKLCPRSTPIPSTTTTTTTETPANNG